MPINIDRAMRDKFKDLYNQFQLKMKVKDNNMPILPLIF